MKNKIFLIFTMISLLLVSACSNTNNTNNPTINDANMAKDQLEDQYESLGFNQFDFSATALDSIEYNKKYFENSKVTMINFWGTFCAPCIREMPELQELLAEYEKEDFQILGVIVDTFEGTDTNLDNARAIIEKLGVTYLNIIPNENLYENYLKNVQAVPTTIFVDKEGNLIGNIVSGSKDKEYFKEIIDTLISEQ